MIEVSPAELLLDIATYIRHSSGIVVVDNAPDNYAEVAVLALRLQANPALALRAQVENWNKLQIVKELW